MGLITGFFVLCSIPATFHHRTTPYVLATLVMVGFMLAGLSLKLIGHDSIIVRRVWHACLLSFIFYVVIFEDYSAWLLLGLAWSGAQALWGASPLTPLRAQPDMNPSEQPTS